MLKVCLVFITLCVSLFGTFFNLFASSGRSDFRTDALRLFKEENYREIVDQFENKRIQSDLEQLLLAKAYERLGFYEMSIESLKELYRVVSFDFLKSQKLFIAYFIGTNYEMLEDYSSAMLWYSRVLSGIESRSSSYGEAVDRLSISTATLRRINTLYRKRKVDHHTIEKVMKRQNSLLPHVLYFTAVVYHSSGRLRDAADYYVQLLRGETNVYTKKTLEQIVNDSRLIYVLGQKGVSKTDLIHLCIQYSLHDGALFISHFIPYDKYVAQLRAYCFYEKGDYQSAAVLYEDYFSAFEDPDALVKLAYCYFYLGDRRQSVSYLAQYLKNRGNEKNVSADAAFLKLLLDRDHRPVEQNVKQAMVFLQTYKGFPNSERFIYDTFYYILQTGNRDFAVEFLQGSRYLMKSPIYEAWAYSVLSLYDSSSFFADAVIHAPGSYYYFVAAERAAVGSDALRRADMLFEQKRYEEALDLYVLLFSRNIQKKRAESKILEILSGVLPYSYFFEIVKTHEDRGSVLMELLDSGLYREIFDIIDPDYVFANSQEGVYQCYILSTACHETGNIVGGVLYGEKMLDFTDRKYVLFLPVEILKLCYPSVYVESIVKFIQESISISDPLFILALIRAESMYDPKAKSQRGALGLMQILPETAAWLEGKHVLREELFDPSRNIEIGIKYLHFLFERFESKELVLAAYNGGPTNVKRWMTRNGYDELLYFIEEIPFFETRNYVKKVIANYELYRYIYDRSF